MVDATPQPARKRRRDVQRLESAARRLRLAVARTLAQRRGLADGSDACRAGAARACCRLAYLDDHFRRRGRR